MFLQYHTVYKYNAFDHKCIPIVFTCETQMFTFILRRNVDYIERENKANFFFIGN